MKKVLFICLLSLSVCLGKPANDQGLQVIPSTPTPAPAVAKSNQTAPSHEAANVNITTPETPVSVSTEAASVTTSTAKTTTVAPKSTTVVPNTIPDKTGDKTANIVPAKDNLNTTTKPPHVTEKADTTPKPEGTTKSSTTTAAPHKADDKPTLQSRGFDGASFMGGIILALGMLALGFMGYKYYKNTTERNYHTL